MPDKCDDVNLVTKTLINARAFKELPNRKHSQYPCVQEDPFTGIVTNMETFKNWLENKQRISC